MDDYEGELQDFDFEQTLDSGAAPAAAAPAVEIPAASAYSAAAPQLSSQDGISAMAVPQPPSGLGAPRPSAAGEGMFQQPQQQQFPAVGSAGFQIPQAAPTSQIAPQHGATGYQDAGGGFPGPVPAHIPQHMRRSYRQTVCRHWVNGLCQKGDDCSFLHQFVLNRMPVCPTFKKHNMCPNTDCVFKHSLEDLKECNMYVSVMRGVGKTAAVCG